MAIKKLQNNFTTPEQSKRLLELGVPADSADCYYYEPLGECNFIYILQNSSPLKETERRQRIIVHPDTKLYPCWSVGRLIEIYNKCVDFDLDDGAAIVIFIQDESPIDQIMEMFEDKVGIMDFSKLED